MRGSPLQTVTMQRVKTGKGECDWELWAFIRYTAGICKNLCHCTEPFQGYKAAWQNLRLFSKDISHYCSRQTPNCAEFGWRMHGCVTAHFVGEGMIRGDGKWLTRAFFLSISETLRWEVWKYLDFRSWGKNFLSRCGDCCSDWEWLNTGKDVFIVERSAPFALGTPFPLYSGLQFGDLCARSFPFFVPVLVLLWLNV